MAMRFSFRSILSAVAALGLAGGAAQAGIISFNLRINAAHVITSQQTAGAPGVHVGNWNNEGSSALPNLIDSTGAPTTADYSLVSEGDFGYGSGWYAVTPDAGDSGDRRLLSQFRETTGTKILRVAIAEIPYATYDLYAYFGGAAGRVGSVTANGTTIHFGAAGDSLTYAQATSTDVESPSLNTNYAVFRGLTGSSIFIDYVAADSALPIGFSGFQIVEVPEPASIGLLMLGGLPLLVRRRSNA